MSKLHPLTGTGMHHADDFTKGKKKIEGCTFGSRLCQETT